MSSGAGYQLQAWSLRASWRFYQSHPGQLLLTLLGLALGVAIATSVILTTASARKAFSLSTEALYGSATHQIVGGSQGVPAAHYRKLRTELGLQRSAPIVEGTASLHGEVFNLLGIAPLAELQLQPQRARSFSASGAMQRFVSTPFAVALDRDTATRLGLSLGDTLALDIDGSNHKASLALMLNGQAGSAMVMLTYIENARQWLQRGDSIDRIDLLLTATELQTLQRWMPDNLRLLQSSSRGEQMREMSAAFDTNLTAMSLLALLVGAFLIHNTMSFMVLSRRRHYALYRSLGVTRAEIVSNVLLEAGLLALTATLLGALLGVWLAGQLIHMVSQTINDLYFVLTVRDLQFSLWHWLLCIVLGTLAGTLPAVAAALDAARTPPGQLLQLSTLEQHSRRRQRGLLAAAALLLLTGAALLQISSASLLPGFAALFALVMGYALLVPSLSLLLLACATRLMHNGGWRATHAIGAIQRNMSRYGVALAALCVAIAATVGVDLMVGSFRSSVEIWLEQTLRSDIYIAAPSRLSSRAHGNIEPQLRHWLEQQGEIDNITSTRRIKVQSRGGEVSLLAIDPGMQPLLGLTTLAHQHNDPQAYAAARAVQISEPLARKYQLQVGDSLELFTDQSGWQSFPVAAVFRDYGSSSGMLSMHRSLYRLHWQDDGYSTLGISLITGTDLEQPLQRLRSYLEQSELAYIVRDNDSIRSKSLEVFDRTFAITQLLRLLTVAVAFLGLFSALMSVLLEKTREFAIFRALGARASEMTALIIQQALIIGLLASVLAIPLGLLLAALLIQVINLRSFGWTIHMQLSAMPLLQALALGLLAALLASIWPARRLRKLQIAHAMRSE